MEIITRSNPKGKPFFSSNEPEEIIFNLAGGDINQINTLKKTKVSEIMIMTIIKSKENFTEWYNKPDEEEE